jgi:hypothetical protein
LTLGFAQDVQRAPYRIAPEKAVELNLLFGAKPLTLVFSDGAANFYARPNDSEIGVTFAALLSLWAAARAALHIGNEAMAATRSKRAKLDRQPGTPIAEAYDLIKAAKNLIQDPRARWPNDLPEPNARAVKRSPDWYANNLFLGAVGWTLLHEVAHIRLNHQETTSELRRRQEHEADQWATKWIFERAGQGLNRDFRIFATATGIIWVGLIDIIRRGSTTHPHASERFYKCSNLFGADPIGPGLELAAHITKLKPSSIRTHQVLRWKPRKMPSARHCSATPACRADPRTPTHGYEATREAAMAAFLRHAVPADGPKGAVGVYTPDKLQLPS